jgi:hypothetical protein
VKDSENPTFNSKNPIMRSLENRKQSFINKGWNQSITISVDELSEAGFYYTGVDDLVKCFHCNGGLQDWKANDNALLLHNKYYPNCNYSNLKKRLFFIKDCGKHETNGNMNANI